MASPTHVLSFVVPWSRVPLPRGASTAALRVFSQMFSHGDDAYSLLRDRAVNVSVTWANIGDRGEYTWIETGAIRCTFHVYAEISATPEQQQAFATAMLLELESP